MQSLRSLLKPRSEDKVEKVNPQVKLDTVFSFKNLGSDHQKMLAEIERILEIEAYLFLVNCYMINGEYHQVNELQLISSDINSPERKVHLENARLANGVTTFGSGPDPTLPKVLFEVCRTYIIYDWSSHELPMPTLATCFFTTGVRKQYFPGPKFPMSHRLGGFGSEMNMESVSAVDKDISINLRAEFKPFPHFRQDLCHRIVLPGMCVSDFLSLDFRVKGPIELDDRFEEPFVITEVKIELQEFTSTHNHEEVFQDIRTKMLLEGKPFESIMLSKRPLRILAKIYSCELPMVGPTFFTNDLTRSYGLKATFKLSHDKIGEVTSTAFVELNMAQDKSERIRDEDFDYWRYHGCANPASSYTKPEIPSSKDDTRRLISSFSQRLACFDSRFIHYQILSYTIGKKKCMLFIEQLNEPLTLPGYKSCDWKSCLKRRVDFYMGYLRSFYNNQARIISMVTELPVPGGDATNSGQPYASNCLLVGDKIVHSLPTFNIRFKRVPRDVSDALGVSNIPVAARLTLTENQSFSQTQEWALATMVRPGMKLSEFMNFSFIVAQSYDNAGNDLSIDDMELVIERIEITLVEEEHLYWKGREIVLCKKSENFPVIRWESFKDIVDGCPKARSFRLPREVLDGEIPLDVKPSVLWSEYEPFRRPKLYSRILLRSGERQFTSMWEHRLFVV